MAIMPRTTLQITKTREEEKAMKFEIPEIMIEKFGVADVITISGGLDENETPEQPGDWD